MHLTLRIVHPPEHTLKEWVCCAMVFQALHVYWIHVLKWST